MVLHFTQCKNMCFPNNPQIFIQNILASSNFGVASSAMMVFR